MIDQQFINYIYTDSINEDVLRIIKSQITNIDFIIRDESKWNSRYISNIITDPVLSCIVINNFNDLSISEITLASFMCKKILVTDPKIKNTPLILDLISDLQPSCNLNIVNNSFITWIKGK